MDTTYAFTDPRAQTYWAKEMFKYAMPNVVTQPLMGKTPNNFIYVTKDLTQRPGGTIIIKARQPLENVGVGDDGDTTGVEGQIKRRNMSMLVHERANASRSGGKMSEKLTDSEFRVDAKLELGDWLSECIEDDVCTSMYGGYNENSSSGAIETINESYPTTRRIFYGGQDAAGTIANGGASYANDAALTAGGVAVANTLMGTRLLSAIRRRAVASTPRFRGAIVPDISKLTDQDIRNDISGPPVGGAMFCVLLHPYQIKSIREETGATGWAAMTAAAQVRGNLNPIFSGAAFYWDGMICWEYDRVATRTGAGTAFPPEGFLLDNARTATLDPCGDLRTVARAMLLGAQAVVLAWGMMPQWGEDYYDVNKRKVKVDMIYGVKRTNFNAHGTTTPGQDEAIYCIDTHVQVDA